MPLYEAGVNNTQENNESESRYQMLSKYNQHSNNDRIRNNRSHIHTANMLSNPANLFPYSQDTCHLQDRK